MTTLLLCSSFSMHVEAAVPFSFETPNDYLGPASSWPAWQKVLDQHRIVEQPNIQTCVQDEALCSKKLRSVGHIIRRGEVLPERKKLQLVNRYINKRRYRRDRRTKEGTLSANSVKGTRNSWTNLTPFLSRGGDCEDYATAKYFILREMGFKAHDMRIVVAWNRREHAYHARLAVKLEDKIMWLDNDNSISWTSHRAPYRYIYSINEENIWDHQSPDKNYVKNHKNEKTERKLI